MASYSPSDIPQKHGEKRNWNRGEIQRKLEEVAPVPLSPPPPPFFFQNRPRNNGGNPKKIEEVAPAPPPPPPPISMLTQGHVNMHHTIRLSSYTPRAPYSPRWKSKSRPNWLCEYILAILTLHSPRITTQLYNWGHHVWKNVGVSTIVTPPLPFIPNHDTHLWGSLMIMNQTLPWSVWVTQWISLNTLPFVSKQLQAWFKSRDWIQWRNSLNDFRLFRNTH